MKNKPGDSTGPAPSDAGLTGISNIEIESLKKDLKDLKDK